MAEEGFGISQEHPKFNCSSKIHSFFSFSFLSIPRAIFQLMQLRVWVLLWLWIIPPRCSRSLSLHWLKGFTGNLLLCFDEAQSKVVVLKRTPKMDISKQLLLKKQWNFDARDISTILTVNMIQRIHVIIHSPQFHQGLTIFINIYFCDSSNPFNFHQIHTEKLMPYNFPCLFLILLFFFTFKSLHFSPIYEEICLKGSAQIYWSVLLTVYLKTYNFLWSESRWMNPLKKKKNKKKIQGWINGNTQFPTAAWPEHPKGESFC